MALFVAKNRAKIDTSTCRWAAGHRQEGIYALKCHGRGHAKQSNFLLARDKCRTLRKRIHSFFFSAEMAWFKHYISSILVDKCVHAEACDHTYPDIALVVLALVLNGCYALLSPAEMIRNVGVDWHTHFAYA